MKRFTFKKTERLKSATAIARLFKEGHSFGVFPLRLVWMKMPERSDAVVPVQFAVSVSKRNFKSAVVRNRIKRQVREAWRLQKPSLYEQLQEMSGQLAFLVIYTAKEELPFTLIEKASRTMIFLFLKKNRAAILRNEEPPTAAP
ncbi:MAG: hypothetical protein RI973_2447 [Bacteroidota bacterium]|jgi:ribonuclease P protein component